MAKGFCINDKGYVITGIQSNGSSYTTDNYEYDPVANTWTARTSFTGSARYASTGFVLNNTLYLGMGYDGSYKADFYSYLPNSTPTVTTTAISSISTTSASSGGNVIGDGGTSVTARGLVWSATVNPPTISSYDGITSNSTGTGAFTQTINALCPGTTYYVRAYATNSAGTSYGASETFTTTASPGDIWVQKANFGGTARNATVAFTIGTKGYIGTGNDISSASSDFWEYDIYSNVWTQKANYGGGNVRASSGFALGGKGYLGCGFDGSYRNDFWEYNPSTNVWTSKASFSGTARYNIMTAATSTRGYFIGGTNSTPTNVNEVWEYNPGTNTWTSKTNFGGGVRRLGGVFVINDLIYIAGGHSTGSTVHNDLYVFDPTLNTWTQKTSFSGTARNNLFGFSISNKGYIGLGTNEAGTIRYSDIWEYDITQDIWIQKGNFSGTARSISNTNFFSIGNKGYIGTGYDGTNLLQDFYEYTPNTIPQFISGSAGSITSSGAAISATYDANYNGCCSSAITDHGLVWHTATAPTTGTNTGTVSAGAGTSTISHTITGLTANTTYYVRSYSTSAQGTRYGNEVSFTTSAGAPTVATNAITSIVTTSASSGGNVTSDGGAAVTARGLVWSATVNPPTISSYDGITSNSTGTGNFTQTINALCPGTTYNVRAYATNSAGTSYGASETFTTTASPGDIWVQKTSFPNGARYQSCQFTIGNKLYIGMGTTGVSNYDDLWEYDVNADTWTQKTSFPNGLITGTINFAINGKGYACGGVIGGFWQKTVFEYDPTLNTWTQKNDLPLSGGFANRSNGLGLANSTRGYIIGGFDCSLGRAYTEIIEYNPSNDSWVQRPNFHNRSSSKPSGFVVDENLYVYATGNCVSVMENSFFSYNTSTNTWSSKASYPGTASVRGIGFAIGKKGYIGTGREQSLAVSNSLFEYDVATDIWKQISNVPTAGTEYANGISLGNKAYYGLGASIGINWYEYTPSTIPAFLITNGVSSVSSSGGIVSAVTDANFNGCATNSITSKGIILGTSNSFTLSNASFTFTNGSGNSNFSTTLSGLSPATTYFARAFSTSAAGSNYGNSVSFTTLADLPTITTTAISNLTSVGVESGGIITSDGGATVTTRGVVWGTNPNPTVALATKTSDASGTGTFTSNVTGLTPGTVYYLRAYATNSAGTAYGSEATFTTLNIPSLTTIVPDNITGTDAQSGGVITSDGNDPITAKGVVWDINPNPTVALVTKTNNGSGISSFGSVVNGLSYNTDYYVRAYATNSTGTAYGQQEFFTSNASSVVLLNDVYLTGERGFTFVATATDDGGQAITERGVVWGASRNPRITNEKKTFGNGLGLFRGTVLDLLPETKYYVRTYLINSDGISYSSNQIVYTADNDAVPTVTELQAPNNGDGNGDGIPDYAQRNVVTIRSTNGNYVTIASADPTKEILVPQALASLERNPNFDYPHGMYSFNINASSATITMYFHGITNLSNAVYRKVTSSGLWANFPFVTFSSVMIGTTRVATATLVLTDGSFGDSDGIANGVITDPGGPAIPAAAVSNIPTISEWARIFLISLLLVLGVWKIRKYV